MKTKVTFYLPSLDAQGNPIELVRSLKNQIIREAALSYGGATTWDTRGYWRDPDTDQLLEESTTLVQVFIDKAKMNGVGSFAGYIGETLKQKEILYTVLDTPFFVKAANF